ncbi:TPA: hypothetical protein P2K63_004639, partial [Aeromonas salmonicida]|nr:hypothetical protein [Aeromonas salmonicida]HDN9381517.1 hypothetical protein [Aeromonas salmonicida]HDN9393995.1 hypothetical protein [Aeromonas salmonicida]HDN9415970.1 hypothetical protein [Aeromonas salmonicida]HDN9425090.1 hypothetical protein [Aeromonas salmonicida]
RVVGGNQIRALVDAVRDQLLTWALDLVEAGIEGDEIPSPPQPLAPVTIRIDGGFHGGQLMVSSLGGLQQQTVTYPQKAADQPGGGQESELDTLKAQAAAPKWKLPVIAAVASTVVVILEGAGGGVLTDLVLKWLATLNGH